MGSPYGTRPVDAAQFAVEDTSIDGPEFAATPGVTARGPKTGAAVCVQKGAPFTSAQRSRILAQVVAHASAGLGKALAMRQQPPLPGLVVSTPRRRAPVARPILPRPRPTFLLSRSNVALATLAVAAVAGCHWRLAACMQRAAVDRASREPSRGARSTWSPEGRT